MASEGDEGGSDQMRDRAEGSTWKLWLLLSADRRLVSAGISAFVFLGVLAVGIAHPTPARAALTTGDPAETLFQGLTTTIVTGVTLVLTLNQLVISEELGPVGDQRERMEGAITFRGDVRDRIPDPVAPAEPAALLQALVEQTGREAETLREAVKGAGGSARADVLRLVDAVIEDAESVGARLENARFGRFEAIYAALDYNYSWKLYAAERLDAVHDDAIDEAAATALEDLTETLQLFAPAREHVKTLYFRWELVDLSRAVAVAAIPALVVSVAGLLFFDPTAFPGAVLGVDLALLQVATAVGIAVTPFSLLLAYVLRIATVAKRTLSIGAFVLREIERPTAGDWE